MNWRTFWRKPSSNPYVTREQQAHFIRLIANTAEFVPIIQLVRECRDSNDDKFLEIALNGQADLIITGKHPGEWQPVLASSKESLMWAERLYSCYMFPIHLWRQVRRFQ
jgi:hypothetical protein